MNRANDIANWISEAVREKYERGQREHGGDLFRKSVLPHLVEEVVDLVVYVAVLQEQITKIEMLCELGSVAYEGDKQAFLTAICNLITKGNMEGIDETELASEPKTKLYSESKISELRKEILEWLIR